MSHSQFHCIKSFILRHAWLNLWDKHMTTGRINQVTLSLLSSEERGRRDSFSTSMSIINGIFKGVLYKYGMDYTIHARKDTYCLTPLQQRQPSCSSKHFQSIDFNSVWIATRFCSVFNLPSQCNWTRNTSNNNSTRKYILIVPIQMIE